jgi:hypothetical protein
MGSIVSAGPAAVILPLAMVLIAFGQYRAIMVAIRERRVS